MAKVSGVKLRGVRGIWRLVTHRPWNDSGKHYVPGLLAAVLLMGLPGAVMAQSSPPIDSDLVQPQGQRPAPAPIQTQAQPYARPDPYAQPDPYADPYAPASPAPYQPPAPPPPAPYPQAAYPQPAYPQPAYPQSTYPQAAMAVPAGCAGSHYSDGTYHEDDLIGVADDVFGEAAHGLADIIQDIFKKQGRPNGYIIGREAGGAIAVGLRYGSGTLCSRLGWKQPVYWTGPSVGFDFGASAAKTFVLVYNLYHDQDIYHRFGAGEGQVYFIGGFHVSYLRYDRVVLIPVRMGVGLRMGVNGGYMKFSRHQNWLPF